MKLFLQALKDMVRAIIRAILPVQLRWFCGRELKMSAEEWSQVQLSYSQYGEDLLVWELLRREGRTARGFYIDVGAFDPVQYSNTNLLYHRGWTGLNLDLNEEAITRFNRLRSRDINVHCAISNETTQMMLCKYASGSTNRLLPIDSGDRKSLLGEEPIQIIPITTLPLSKILDKYVPPGSRIDFLDVDCEGHDLAVLKSNDWSKYRPLVLAVEDTTNEADSETIRYCSDQGYDLAATLFISRIFLDRNASEATKAALSVYTAARV